MKARKMILAFAACIALSTSAFAETDEERIIANCDWPAAELATHDATAAESRPLTAREEEALANCDWPEAEITTSAPAKPEPDRGSARSDEDLFASCDYPEAA